MNLESPTSKLSALFFPWRQTRLVSQVGGEVARQCRADFWQCVASRVVGMEVAEIKGYVRAVADAFIVAEVDQVSQSTPVERRSSPSSGGFRGPATHQSDRS